MNARSQVLNKDNNICSGSGNIYCHRLLVQVVDWCASRLVKLICSQIMSTASSPIKDVDLPLTCHPSPGHTTFAFRSSEVRRLLLDLDPYRGTDPLGMFTLFFKRTADIQAGQCHPCSEGSTILFCCQLLTDFHNISIV